MGIAQTFTCSACLRQHTWKSSLVGKQGKCKCGRIITIPSAPDPQPEPEEGGLADLSELAADAERAVADLPPTIVEGPIAVAAPAARLAKTSRTSKTGGAKQPPLMSKPPRDDNETFIDMKRDVHAPTIIAVAGAILLIGYYMYRYSLGGSSLVGLTVGLSIMNAIEAILLIGFAIVVAGPLGVSFGDFRTAWYKFAAIAIFADGATAWVDGTVAKMSGGFGAGVLGFGVIGLPVAFVIYWLLVTFLFSMDQEDSRLFVALLTVFYRVSRVIIIVLLLRVALSWGGVANSAMVVPSLGGAPAADPIREQIAHAHEMGYLIEARAYIIKRGRISETPAIESFYSAGAKTVWYEESRDINGHGDAFRLAIELPPDPAARVKVYHAVKTNWLDALGIPYDPDELSDMKVPYLFVGMPHPH